MKKDISIKSKENFIKKYGHIRPNTYEITTKNYKDSFDKYFDTKKILQSSKKKRRVNFTTNQKKQIMQYLKKNNFNFTINQFLIFLSESIAMREYSKFIFTKNIDAIFNYLKIFLKRYKIKENDIAFLDINTIKNFYYNLSNHNIKDTLLNEINTNKANYLENVQLKLPEVITNKKDIYFYFEGDNKINFVGTKSITSNILEIKKIKNKNQIKKKIILIENADPGYDYLFTYKIDGLITKFGGANSHMSIRCSELGIPAAIGVGEKKYNEIINTKKIMIDCLNEKILLIS